MCRRPLFYMAPMGRRPVGNATHIRMVGILSFNLWQSIPGLSQNSTSIADPCVNSRRHVRQIDGRSLHDFVPFYWATHTPMQYALTVRDKLVSQDKLVFFVFDAEEMASVAGYFDDGWQCRQR